MSAERVEFSPVWMNGEWILSSAQVTVYTDVHTTLYVLQFGTCSCPNSVHLLLGGHLAEQQSRS
jgi:predicted nucleic acid-binding Zn finger protein